MCVHQEAGFEGRAMTGQIAKDKLPVSTYVQVSYVRNSELAQLSCICICSANCSWSPTMQEHIQARTYIVHEARDLENCNCRAIERGQGQGRRQTHVSAC